MRPPIFFSPCRKEDGPRPGQKKRAPNAGNILQNVRLYARISNLVQIWYNVYAGSPHRPQCCFGIRNAGCACRGGPRGRPKRCGLHPQGVHHASDIGHWLAMTWIFVVLPASRGKERSEIPVRSTIERQRYAWFQATPHCSSGDPGCSLGLPAFAWSPEDTSSGRLSLKSKKRFFPRRGKKCVLTCAGPFRQTQLLGENLWLTPAPFCPGPAGPGGAFRG